MTPDDKTAHRYRMDFTAIQPTLAGEPEIVAAFVLGSAARGTARPDSDVDIAVLYAPGRRRTAAERVALAARLSALLGREVDLGTISADNLIYAKEAYLTGECIFARDPAQRDLTGATMLGLYADLRRARKEVERAYRTQ